MNDHILGINRAGFKRLSPDARLIALAAKLAETDEHDSVFSEFEGTAISIVPGGRSEARPAVLEALRSGMLNVTNGHVSTGEGVA